MRKRCISIILLLAFVVCTSALAWAQTITTEKVLVPVGKTAESSIMINSAAKGISSYTFTIRLDNGDIADIEKVILSAAFNKAANVSIAEDGNSVTISASDADGLVQAGTRDVELARVVLRGTANGVGEIQFVLNQILDDNGGQVNPAVKEGKLNVIAGPNTPTIVGGQDSLQIGETVETPIILSQTPPGGLKNYRVTVSLRNQDKNVVKIQGVKFVAFAGNAKVALAADGSSVNFSAADLNDEIQAGAAGIILARVIFTGQLPGTVTFNVMVNSVESDTGSISATPGMDGSLSVGGLVNQAPTFSSETPRKIAKIQIAQPLISIGIDDDLEELDPTTIRLKITDSSKTLEFNRSSSGTLWDGRTFSVNLQAAGAALAVGGITVVATASDLSGNEASFTWNFSVAGNAGGTPPPSGAQPIERAIAGEDGIISDAEIVHAIQLWILGDAVPGTGGQTISDVMISKLVQLWITGMPV